MYPAGFIISLHARRQFALESYLKLGFGPGRKGSSEVYNRAFHIFVQGPTRLDLLSLQGFRVKTHVTEVEIGRVKHNCRRFFLDV